MSDIAMKVENISKKYTIGSNAHDTLRNSLSNLFSKRTPKQEFWALKDINFEIRKGEAVGIIGSNGAGKSTLLKILSKITRPTTGKAVIDGRVASLLEVGTGFHPELTGRENIFLNGALLGMTKEEIKSQFDEIVAFSGIKKFIDTPVKRYSSGMYVRLAFAVAAHLNSEILLVDEVLAVGDYEFRKKCLNKMQSLSEKSDKTVLFVSHNLASIESLCERSMLLIDGQISAIGNSREIINLYKNGILEDSNFKDVEKYRQAKRSQEVRLTSCNPISSNNSFSVDDDVILELELESKGEFKNLLIEIFLYNEDGEKISEIYSWDATSKIDIHNETIQLQISLGQLPLLPGTYFGDVRIKNAIGTSALDYIERIPLFEIANNGDSKMKVKFDRRGALAIIPKITKL